jgi:hypothetical protein
VVDEEAQEEPSKVADEEAATPNEEQLANDSDRRAIEEAVQDTEKIGRAIGTNNPPQKQRPNEAADVEEITLEQKAKDYGFNTDGLEFDNEDDKKDFWYKVARYISPKPTDSVRTINSFKRAIETTIAAGGHRQEGRLRFGAESAIPKVSEEECIAAISTIDWSTVFDHEQPNEEERAQIIKQHRLFRNDDMRMTFEMMKRQKKQEDDYERTERKIDAQNRKKSNIPLPPLPFEGVMKSMKQSSAEFFDEITERRSGPIEGGRASPEEHGKLMIEAAVGIAMVKKELRKKYYEPDYDKVEWIRKIYELYSSCKYDLKNTAGDARYQELWVCIIKNFCAFIRYAFEATLQRNHAHEFAGETVPSNLKVQKRNKFVFIGAQYADGGCYQKLLEQSEDVLKDAMQFRDSYCQNVKELNELRDKYGVGNKKLALVFIEIDEVTQDAVMTQLAVEDVPDAILEIDSSSSSNNSDAEYNPKKKRQTGKPQPKKKH